MHAHMHNKLRIGENDRCPCGTGPMDTEHLLQHCPAHEELRNNTWPEPPNMKTQLYGTQEDLERTAGFVRRAGVTI